MHAMCVRAFSKTQNVEQISNLNQERYKERNSTFYSLFTMISDVLSILLNSFIAKKTVGGRDLRNEKSFTEFLN